MKAGAYPRGDAREVIVVGVKAKIEIFGPGQVRRERARYLARAAARVVLTSA